MTELRRHARYALVLATALLAAGCGEGGDEGAAAAVDVDTTNKDHADGLSTSQVQAEARAMTPQEAADSGMIDAGIHLENLGSQDTTPAGAQNNDTTPPAPAAPTGPARRDSVRNAQR
jgi:PBP1b-binding outer membrane lipoprotein LpoB